MNLNHVKEFGITKTPLEEFEARLSRMWRQLEEFHLDGMVFFASASITYLTGSPLVATERPIALVCSAQGDLTILVPRLEFEHAQMQLPQCRVVCYPEYPGRRHPMYFLGDLLKDLGLDKKALGADSDGYPPVYGYSGPSLSEILQREDLRFFPRLIQQMKVHKSPYEISLIRESSRWSHYALSLLQEYTKPGLREFDVSFQAGIDASKTMLKTLGKRYHPNSLSDCGVWVGYRGQVGVDSYYPHAVTTNAQFHPGDLLGCYASADIGGYICELERNFFMGEPTPEQRTYYQLALELQQTALEAIRPGARCCDVDEAVQKFYQKHHLEDAWRHHTGHSLGSGMHECPVLDVGDTTLLEPGMCFSVEPGLYIKDVGGFRISDTIVVQENGIELITYYSRDIESLICLY